VVTTQSKHARSVYPNLLPGTAVTRLNRVWIAEMTYIRLPTRFVYLASILDAYSRRCIGWRLGTEIDTALARGGLEQASAARTPAAGWISTTPSGDATGERGLCGALSGRRGAD
jgi:putative transposase